ncbi:Phosphotransferase enzyme family protein [compost metagenome]
MLLGCFCSYLVVGMFCKKNSGGDIINYNEAVAISEVHLLPLVSQLYELEGYDIKLVRGHYGGRNVVYSCENPGSVAKIIRISFLEDRERKDFLAELEYVRYVSEQGGSVSDVVDSQNGNKVEEITYRQHTFYICLFKKARGTMMVDNNYRYREGAPISEYYYNCGKVLGKLHHISKGYTPVQRRYSFFDKYTAEYIEKLIPDSLPLLKEKLIELLGTLEGVQTSRESFGMLHFDYNDGNYTIDYDSGQITVYDFDNCCFGWYMFDLASLWTNGVGWIQSEPDASKRKEFMDRYFEVVLAGYRSETEIEDIMLGKLPLFIQVTLLEGILDEFEVMQRNGEDPKCDEELSYRIKCLEENIPYMGFFHEIYST